MLQKARAAGKAYAVERMASGWDSWEWYKLAHDMETWKSWKLTDPEAKQLIQ